MDYARIQVFLDKGFENLSKDERSEFVGCLVKPVLEDMNFVADNFWNDSVDAVKWSVFLRENGLDYVLALLVASFLKRETKLEGSNQNFCHKCGAKLLF